MAKGGNRKQRAPVYSADTLALRIFFGIALAALGVIIFMAVVLRMGGVVFDGVRNVSFGLTGGMAVLLPVFFLWAGILMIWSSQSRAPVKPLLWASLAYIGICTFIILVSLGPDKKQFMTYLSQMYGRNWGNVIRGGFEVCQKSGANGGGGSLGILLGWPLQQVLGDVLSAGIILILTILCVLMALNLSPKRIRDLATGRVQFRRSRQEAERDRAGEEQMAWQQEQERQRQAWQQAMLQQQQAQAQQMQGSQAYTAPQGYTASGYTAPVTGAGPLPDDRGVAEWQTQLGDLQAQQDGGKGRSRIFGKKNGDQPEQAAAKGSFMSRIFHRTPENDGLSDASSDEKERQAREAREQVRRAAEARQARMNTMRTAAARENPAAGTQAGARPAEEESMDPRIRPQQRAEAEHTQSRPQENTRTDSYAAPEQAGMGRTGTNPADQTAYMRPDDGRQAQGAQAGRAAEAAGRNGMNTDARGGSGRAAEAAARNEMNTDARGGSGRAAEAAGRNGMNTDARGESGRTGEERGGKAADWTRQLEDAERKAAGEARESRDASGHSRGPAPERERPAAEPARIPAVQQKIGEETWKPELAHVHPKEEDGAGEEYWTPTPYYAPSVRNLRMPEMNKENTAEEDAMRSRRLEETLASFNVIAKVVHVTHGPAISRFELELASGTKVSKVAGLEKDIAYGMQATSVRIEAPIPGKSLVGVEVPNRKVSMVTLREVLESPAMQNAKSLLTVALGKDIAGTPVVCDLAKMPHMLIAGATGSGKSVCINAIINSLLFRAGPEEVKLILVDPKVVELQIYNNIPHLLIPVVSDPHKAAAALAWAVAEMMDRYDRFAKRKVRNLDGYNSILEPGEKPMPRIVIIIDELADLMMVCKKDVEEYICRLTQLARAAGIHLIVATQRPSVDVITGLIKANIPSRIAFKTASYVDSRTILDRNGSEQLLGYGDMLYLPTGSFSPTRIQGCFLSDEEVNQIAADVKRANPSSYDQDILDKLDELSSESGETPGMDMIGGVPDSAADGSLFEQAVEFAIADGQISTSTLQRRLKVGYARAGRLTDEMEERGIVSAKDGSKPRKCLITREQWEEMKRSTEGMT